MFEYTNLESTREKRNHRVISKGHCWYYTTVRKIEMKGCQVVIVKHQSFVVNVPLYIIVLE